MLIPCPECERKVSDRAKACPDCAFPVAEHVAEQAAERERVARLASRSRVGEIDCPACEARGFRTFEAANEQGVMREMFEWCSACKHSGRIHQCRDLAGFYAVSHAALEQFLAGQLDTGHDGVWFVGSEAASEHRYPSASEPQAEGPVSDNPDGTDTESS